MTEPLQALLAARGDRDRILAALADTVVYVPSTTAGGDGTAALPVVTHGARRFVPVFTTLALARTTTAPESGHIELPLRTVAAQVGPEVWIAVDPTAPTETLLAPGELRRILGRPLADVGQLPPGLPVRVGDPAAEPDDLLAALGRELAAVPSVARAYRALVQVGDGIPGLVIGVDAPPEDMGKVLPAVEAALARLPYGNVDIVRIGDLDEITGWMTESTRPFYERSG